MGSIGVSSRGSAFGLIDAFVFGIFRPPSNFIGVGCAARSAPAPVRKAFKASRVFSLRLRTQADDGDDAGGALAGTGDGTDELDDGDVKALPLALGLGVTVFFFEDGLSARCTDPLLEAGLLFLPMITEVEMCRSDMMIDSSAIVGDRLHTAEAKCIEPNTWD